LFVASLPLYAGPWHGSPLGLGAAWFVDTGIQPGWREETAAIRFLWHARTWGAGVAVLGLTAWTALRRRPEALGALAALSGRRPWLGAAAVALVLLCGAWWRVFTTHEPDTLQWLPVCYTVLVACVARLVEALSAPEHDALGAGP
jgi:hypothetical protein